MDDSKPDLIPAVASQSKLSMMKQHAGTVLCLMDRLLKDAGGSAGEQDLIPEEMLSGPWAGLLSTECEQGGEKNDPKAKFHQQQPSILLSEVSLGVSAEFHADSLNDLGIRAVIAPYFGPRIVSDAARLGVLLVPLPIESIQLLKARIAGNPTLAMAINLEQQTIEVEGLETLKFETHPWLRNRLLHGLDDLDELRLYRTDAMQKRAQAKQERPWLFSQASQKKDKND